MATAAQKTANQLRNFVANHPAAKGSADIASARAAVTSHQTALRLQSYVSSHPAAAGSADLASAKLAVYNKHHPVAPITNATSSNGGSDASNVTTGSNTGAAGGSGGISSGADVSGGAISGSGSSGTTVNTGFDPSTVLTGMLNWWNALSTYQKVTIGGAVAVGVFYYVHHRAASGLIRFARKAGS